MPTYYLSDTDLVALTLEELATSAPASLDEAQGWNVDKKANPNYCCYKPDTLRPSTDFQASEPTAFSQLGYRTPNALNGTFAAGNWNFSYKVKCDNYYAQTGYIGWRIWKSANADGSGATQLTPGWQWTPQVVFTAPDQYKSGTVTWYSSTGKTLSNEYLFLEVCWYCQVSGGNNNADVFWVHNEGAAEKLETPTFTPGTQTISNAGNVGTGEAIGTLKIILFLLAAAIASLEAFGTAALAHILQPPGIATAEAHGTPLIRSIIAPSGIETAEQFGLPTVSTPGGLQTLQPEGIPSAEATGTPQVNLALQPSGIATAEGFGTPKTSLFLSPTGITSGEGTGAPKINLGLKPGGIVSGEALGAPQLNLTLKPSGIASQETFGEPVIIYDQFLVNAGNISSAEALGTPKINLALQPTGVTSGEGAGAPKINLGFKPGGIVSGEALGAPQLNLALKPSGLASQEVFGTAVISGAEIQVIQPNGISSAEGAGAPQINLRLVATGAASAETFEQPFVLNLRDILPMEVVLPSDPETELHLFSLAYDAALSGLEVEVDLDG